LFYHFFTNYVNVIIFSLLIFFVSYNTYIKYRDYS